MFSKITIRLTLLVVLITLLNLVYNFTFYKKDLKEISPEIVQLNQTQEETDVYYFGESSNITYKPGDSTQKSISELSALFYPQIRFTNINKYATHAGIYRYWLYQLNTQKKLPEAVIITLNLRSFDAAWRHSKLETPLQQSLIMGSPLPNLLNRFLLSLQAFDSKTEKERERDMLKEWKTVALRFPQPFKYKTVREWDDAMANGGYLNSDGSWNTKKITLACHYIKGYAFNLDEKNQRVRDLDAIYDWCFKNKVSLYFNLMAENVQYADSLVGKELVFLMRQNRDYLVKRYNKENCVVVDNLEAVSGKHFIDQNWTTEHYDDRGRMRIAKNLARAMEIKFKNNYKEVY